MKKNIGIIGGGLVGKTTLSNAQTDKIIVVDNEKEQGITINEMIDKDKAFPITNPYRDLIGFETTRAKMKIKKPYWKNGKLKYK
jgi:hypothetical protein